MDLMASESAPTPPLPSCSFCTHSWDCWQGQEPCPGSLGFFLEGCCFVLGEGEGKGGARSICESPASSAYHPSSLLPGCTHMFTEHLLSIWLWNDSNRQNRCGLCHGSDGGGRKSLRQCGLYIRLSSSEIRAWLCAWQSERAWSRCSEAWPVACGCHTQQSEARRLQAQDPCVLHKEFKTDQAT